MIRKLSFFVGLGAGYVLGAKAGQERYQQIVAKGREIAGMPAVQEATATLSDAASTLTDKATEKAKSTVDSLVDLNGTSTPKTTTKAPGTASTTASTTKAPVTAGTAPRAGAAPSGSAPDAPRR